MRSLPATVAITNLLLTAATSIQQDRSGSAATTIDDMGFFSSTLVLPKYRKSKSYVNRQLKKMGR